MKSDWHFTLFRVLLLYTTGIVLGASLVLGFSGGIANWLTATSMMLVAVAIFLSCRVSLDVSAMCPD